MDHLPCVRDPLHPPIDVPYVVLKEDVYDGLGLLDFLQRLNLKLDMLDNQPQELGVVTSWLQSFCFFEALKVPGVIVATEDFICVTESGRRLITTSRLPNCLWLWPVRVRNQARHVKERQGNEIVPLLVAVYKFVMENFRQLSKLNSPETLRVDLFQDPIYRIMLSIVILAKALTQIFVSTLQYPVSHNASSSALECCRLAGVHTRSLCCKQPFWMWSFKSPCRKSSARAGLAAFGHSRRAS